MGREAMMKNTFKTAQTASLSVTLYVSVLHMMKTYSE